MIYFERPENFSPRFEVASCLLEQNGELLLLKRALHKPQGGTWGVPAGKMDREDNGDPVQTIIREVAQETGWVISSEKIFPVRTFYVRYPDYDFIYHSYKALVPERFVAVLSADEHTDAVWVSPHEALTMPLILDQDFCLKYAYGI